MSNIFFVSQDEEEELQRKSDYIHAMHELVKKGNINLQMFEDVAKQYKVQLEKWFRGFIDLFHF